MANIFRAASLSKDFGNVRVLDGLDFEIAQGSVFGLIGPNGAGKTTTIKILMNILQPSSGQAEVLGRDSRLLRPEDIEKIGYVSENQEMPGWMTVDYLMSYLKPFYPTWDDAHALGLLTRFELPADRPLRQLSRGMLMKAMLASSLAYRPKLLVMDEPFSGLDPLVREDLVQRLAESARETTMFISSHDLGEMESFATHIGYIDGGRLRFCEEMASLNARFRQIEVTLNPNTRLAEEEHWPATWVRREKTREMVRFVDSQFHRERTPAEVSRIFGDAGQVSIQTMPLRSIFIALARHTETV